MKKVFFIVVALMIAFISQAQTYTLPCVLVNGDTLGLVKIPKVYIFPPMNFQSKEEY